MLQKISGNQAKLGEWVLENKREHQLIDQAKSYYDKKAYTKSYEILEQILAENPSCADAHFLCGNIMHIKGQLGKAIKSFKQVLALNADHTDAAISLSVILNDIGKYEEAQKVFESANQKVKKENSGIQDPHINHKFSSKHFELAEMYFAYNRYDEALFEYNKASALNPENFDIRVKIAKVYSKKGYISKSIEVLKELKSESPSYTPAKVALGLIHYGSGNILEAQSEWQNALNSDPNNEQLKMYLKLSQSATETNLTV